MADPQTPATDEAATTPATTPASARKPRARRERKAAPLTAAQMAARLSKAHGATVTAKSVRQWVRDNVDAYADGRYTVHAYDARMVARIEAAWKSRKARSAASKSGGR